MNQILHIENKELFLLLDPEDLTHDLLKQQKFVRTKCEPGAQWTFSTPDRFVRREQNLQPVIRRRFLTTGEG